MPAIRNGLLAITKVTGSGSGVGSQVLGNPNAQDLSPKPMT